MRVSDSILSDNYLRSLNRNKEQVSELQAEISSGSKINKPSDSPSGISRVLRLQEQLQGGDVFAKNISDSQAFMQTTSSVMEGMQSEMDKTLVLFTNANNPTSKDNYDSYSKQIDQTLNTLMDLSNRDFNGKYLFGGTDFSAAPYGFNAGNTGVELKVSAADGQQTVRISKYMEQSVNIKGSDLFQNVPATGGATAASTDIFNTLIRIRDSFKAGTYPADADVALVQQFQNNLTSQLSNAGDILNRLDSTQELLDNQQLEIKNLISKEKDVDVAEAVMNLQNSQYYLNVSYKMSAMILPKSLLDYM